MAMLLYGRRYWAEYLIWFLVFVGTIALSRLASERLPAESPLRLASLVPPALAVLGGFWVELRNLRRIDELQRTMYLESLLYGMVATVLFCALAFLLETMIGLPRVSPMWVIVVNGVGCLVGLGVSWWRYR